MLSETQGIQPQRFALLPSLNAFVTPKDNNPCQQEQPPAYTPAARSSIIGNLAAYLASRNAVPDASGHVHGTIPCSQASVSGDHPDDDLDEPSPISLRISTRINVARDGNIIALPCSPEEQANSIAKAIIEAIQGRDWTTGLPMIDENGLPRPIRLDIDAGITVEGSSNVIGTESVINEVLGRSTQTQRRTPGRQRRSGDSTQAGFLSSPNRKRRASELDIPEHVVFKRARSEE